MAKKPELPEIVVGEDKILSVRGHRVMLDTDLAALYGVPTKRLNERVKRNLDRFPDDFMFALNIEESREVARLRSQSATSNQGRGGRRYAPRVFTEHGAFMLATILDSPSAVAVSIAIVRAFVRIRSLSSVHKELASKVLEHEGKLIKHDRALREVFDAIRQLMDIPPATKKRRIGF